MPLLPTAAGAWAAARPRASSATSLAVPVHALPATSLQIRRPATRQAGPDRPSTDTPEAQGIPQAEPAPPTPRFHLLGQLKHPHTALATIKIQSAE